MTAPNRRIAYRAIDTLLRGVLRAIPPSKISERAALTWGYRFRPEPRTIKLRSGMRFHYERADFIPLLLNYTGTFEPKVIEQIRRLAKPGDTVLDVGANIGFHTLEAWNAVDKNGRIISIEASPSHAEAIKRNLKANGLPTKDVLNVAVGDREGQVTLSLPIGGNEGMFGVNAGTEKAFTVPMRRIDDLLDVPSLALIKMDIEGSELGALHGAKETIKRHKPAILIELNDSALARCGASSNEVVRFLADLGYTGTLINSGAPVTGPHECDECLFTVAV